MRRLVGILTGAFGLAAAYLLFWPVAVDPVPFHPPPNPGMAGAFAPNRALTSAEKVAPGIGPGPEDVTRGPDGMFYTGLEDGRVVRFREDGTLPETWVNTGGRPLGMQFDSDGNLIVADAFRGLLSISPGRETRVLTDRAGGRRLLFPNDLDIASDGSIWFTDASQRFDQHHWILDFLETRGTGSLLRYDRKTGATEVRLSGLLFANGVAVGPNDEFVLVNETLAARITRLWLRGSRAGKQESFLTLPAYPDNLSYNGRGVFWVALAVPRDEILERSWEYVFPRKVMARLPRRLIEGQSRRYSWVVGVDAAGRIVSNLQDPGGWGSVTSVNEFDGKLYLGSIATDFVGRYTLR
ncbi:MAG: SMP-30/gluconolactonase/LRE family protein [Bryobacteraceae bacterium]